MTCFPSKSCEESFSQEPSRKWIKQSCSSLLIEAGEGGEGRAKESYAIILVGGQRRATALGNTHFSTWAWFKKKTRANLIRPLFLTNRMKRELCRFFTLTTYIQHTILGFWWCFGFLVWHWREKAAQTNLFFIPNISVRCYSKSRQENLVVIFF